jgi:hypothetical protein
MASGSILPFYLWDKERPAGSAGLTFLERICKKTSRNYW